MYQPSRIFVARDIIEIPSVKFFLNAPYEIILFDPIRNFVAYKNTPSVCVKVKDGGLPWLLITPGFINRN